MNDDLTARITEALDGAPVHSFRKPIPGGWTCIYCGEASAKGPAGLPVLSGQPCRYAPGMGTIARSLLAEARDEITRLEAERRDHLWLLKGSRLTLDAIAVGREGPADAEAQAQRIVDHTGHGVTDEPPHTLVENDRLRDEIARLREGITTAIDAYDPYGDHQIDAIRALLDAPSTDTEDVPAVPNTEQDPATT